MPCFWSSDLGPIPLPNISPDKYHRKQGCKPQHQNLRRSLNPCTEKNFIPGPNTLPPPILCNHFNTHRLPIFNNHPSNRPPPSKAPHSFLWDNKTHSTASRPQMYYAQTQNSLTGSHRYHPRFLGSLRYRKYLLSYFEGVVSIIH